MPLRIVFPAKRPAQSLSLGQAMSPAEPIQPPVASVWVECGRNRDTYFRTGKSGPLALVFERSSIGACDPASDRLVCFFDVGDLETMLRVLRSCTADRPEDPP